MSTQRRDESHGKQEGQRGRRLQKNKQGNLSVGEKLDTKHSYLIFRIVIVDKPASCLSLKGPKSLQVGSQYTRLFVTSFT